MNEQLELFPTKDSRMPALGMVSEAPRRGTSVGMKVTVLQSGSAGNATLIQGGSTALLIDCGLSLKTLLPRLQAADVSPERLAGVLVTHEHSDHLGGCAALATRFDIPMYMSEGTYKGGSRLLRKRGAKERVHILPVRSWLAFRDGVSVDEDPDKVDLSVDWVPVSHDGRETVSYAVQRKNFRYGVLTDLGCVTKPVARMVGTLDAMSLETNHDVNLLRVSGYPSWVISRIRGSKGHLSNEQAAALIDEHAKKRLKTIFLAHISERANDPERAVKALTGVSEGRTLILTEHRKAIDSVEF